MRIALLMGPYNLTFRGKWTWDNLYDDPRGMSGSELGFVEIGRELVSMGHEVTMITDTNYARLDSNGPYGKLIWAAGEWEHWVGKGAPPRGYPVHDEGFSLAISINHTDGLQHFDCPKVCIQWLNSFEYMTKEQVDRADLWLSPSETHRQFILGQKHWLGDGSTYTPPPDKWKVMPLGCNPELYEGHEKVPGRVIYASSPDRGLHHLLYVWPLIKKAVPEAHLRIFYRLQPWIDHLKAAPYWPDIEENRQRALYIEAALARLADPKWGIEVCGAVSRNRINQEMAEAMCLAYPVDTLRWSEGFSCTTLEACAAESAPVIFDCDALGDVYRDSGARIVKRGDVDAFAAEVIDVLQGWPASAHCRKTLGFAEQHTWRHTCQKLLEATRGLTEKAGLSTSEGTDSTTIAV